MVRRPANPDSCTCTVARARRSKPSAMLLSHLGLAFRRIEFNVDDGSTRTAEFLAKNPNGKVPTIRLADGTHLFESNAILYYFAEGTRYWPQGKRERASALQWMFFEQYS